MATKHFCDQCGDEHATSFAIDWRGSLTKDMQRTLQFEVCDSCRDRIFAAINAIVPRGE